MKVKLTQHYIDHPPPVPANKTKAEHCDIALPGFLWEQRAVNQEWGSFRVRYKSNGRTAYATIGRSCDITLADARKKAKQLKAEIQLGADPRAEIRDRKAVPSLAEFALDSYLPFIRTRKTSYRNDESMLRLYILPALGKYRLDQLKRHQVESFHSGLLSTMSGASADHNLKVIKYMYTKALEHGYCKESPAKGVKNFNICNKIERYLSDEELRRLIATLKADRNRTVANLILFLLATGLRLNSALTSEYKNLDRKNKTLTIEAAQSKNRRRLVIPLNSLAMSVLDDLDTEGKHNFLFVSSRTGKRLTTIRKQFLRLLSVAEIENFRIHDLRHCFCSYALQSGRSIAEVSALASHSSVQVTMRYAHFAKGQLHDASNSTADHIAAALKGGK